LRRLGLFILWFGLLLAGRGASALDLDQVHGELTLNHGELSWYCDPRRQLTAAQLLHDQTRFQPLPASLGRGYTTAACWLRVPLHRARAASGWWFEVPPSYLDDLQLYLFAADGSVQARHSGDRQPFSSRDARYGSFLFKFDVPAGNSTLLLRVQTSSTMLVVLKLIPTSVFLSSPANTWLVFGLFLGIIFTALLLSLVHVLLSRDRIYMLYLAYLVIQLLLAMTLTGMSAEFLLPQWPMVSDRLVGVFLGVLVALSMAFFWSLLRMADGYRWQRGFFVLTGVTGLLTALAALEGDWYVRAAPWMLAAVALTVTLALLPMYQRLRYGNSEDRMFAISFAAYAVFAWLTELSLSGLLPASERTTYLTQIANMTHLIALQISMVVHIRRVEQEAIVARQQLEQQQELADEQEQFLTMITQELRTPLAIIDAASRSLRLHDSGAAREREQRYSRIANAVHRMDLLVRLSLERDRLGEADPAALEPVDLVAFSRQLIGQMPAELQARIHLDSSAAQAVIKIQPDLLQFALINLLDNACKYAPEASAIIVVITRWPARGEVYWSITDQGPGVPVEDRERIFEKYYRGGDRAGKPGLGLGLFIARSLIERYGGRLMYREQSGGACFEVCLPLDGAARLE